MKIENFWDGLNLRLSIPEIKQIISENAEYLQSVKEKDSELSGDYYIHLPGFIKLGKQYGQYAFLLMDTNGLWELGSKNLVHNSNGYNDSRREDMYAFMLRQNKFADTKKLTY